MDRLKVGDVAPEIAGNSVNLGFFKLSALRGKERVFLVFSRYFGCPLCQLDFKDLLERSEEIQKHGRIVYINQSGEESAKNYLRGKVVPFPVILDPKEPYPLYKAYGIGDFTSEDRPRIIERATEARKQGFQHGAYEGNERQSPADFIISKEGIIEYAHYGVLDLEMAMEAWLRK